MTTMLSITTICLSGFMILSHPLLLVIHLVILTLLVMQSMMLLFNCSWLTSIMFLIFLGGLLIIFAYLSAMVPNEMEKKHMYWIIFLMTPLLTSQIFITGNQNNMTKSIMSTNSLQETSFILFLLGYLLMTLMVTMLLSQTLKSPLNQQSY